jgi:hypothetical protein
MYSMTRWSRRTYKQLQEARKGNIHLSIPSSIF